MELKNVKIKFGDLELTGTVANFKMSMDKAATGLGSVALPALRRFSWSMTVPYTGRRSYIDCYILRLAPQTVYSYGGLFVMKKYIEQIYPEYSYESVIKQCLLLRKWSRIYWQPGLWEAHSNMIGQCIADEHQMDFSTFGKRINRVARKVRILGAIRRLW